MKNKKIIFGIFITLLFIGAIICIGHFYKKSETEKYEIPKLYFEGDISAMYTKDDERRIKVKYISNDKDFESYATLKIQGTSSIGYDKKNYNIKFYKDDNYNDKNTIDVGWGEQSKYCLKANWIDKTHARNVVSAKIVSKIQDKYDILEDTPNNGAIDGFPVEIYINNEFLGLYTWNIPKDDWMFNMDSDNENHIVFSSETNTETNFFKDKANYEAWDVEVGRGDDKDLEKLNKLIDFVNNSNDKDFKKNIDKHLNLDITINYIIMVQFAELLDNIGKNLLLATYDGEVWYPILYDLDTSWGTDYNGKGLQDYSDVNSVHASKLFDRVIKLYPEKVKERYFELRKEILTKENVMKEFNDFRELIPDSTFELENNRWNVHYTIPGYDYSQIEEFLDTRIPIVDKYMNAL